MLDPNTNRNDYGKLLAPPSGYTLDFAVSTTYSLDLNALVGACMSLSLGEETDSELLENPIYILDTLHRTGKKLALFCEGGQIQVPSKPTKLHALLENVVFEVVLPKKRGSVYSSFHPKFWLLRYRNAAEAFLYRILVLSRNLTFDRSWDVVFAMDGSYTEKPTEKNVPIKTFLSFLAEKLPKTAPAREKKRGILSLAADLDHIRFDLGSKSFSDFAFLPIGTDRTPTDIRTVLGLSGKRYDELFVMSPFLSNSEIKPLNDLAAGAEAVLFTRRESLSKLRMEDCSRFKIYCMRDEVVNGESALSDGETENVQQQDIHAKVYLFRKGSSVDLFLGSMNASHNALTGNIELMVHLKTLNRYLNLRKLTEELFGKDETKNPFEAVNIADFVQEKYEEGSRLGLIVKDICRAHPHAAVTSTGEAYAIKMQLDDYEKIDSADAEVMIGPLFGTKSKTLARTIVFDGLALEELTSFYRISIKKGEDFLNRIIIVPTESIPSTRDDAIFSSVVCDRQSFVQYLSFLLGDDPMLSALEAARTASENSSATALPAALYEKMLFTAAREPSRFREIDFLMKAIRTDGVIPQDFKQLYETFKKVVKTNEPRIRKTR